MTSAPRTDSLAPGSRDRLLERAAGVDFPTLGHFLEHGFVDPAVRQVGLARRMIGVAATLSLDEPDAGAVNRAIVALRPGEVLVIDMRGDHRHAAIGAVTAAAARARGAAGVLTDGVVTDVGALTDPGAGIPVHARGTSCLTTKQLGSTAGRRQIPVEVGGVRITPGDIVLADANGAVALAPDVLAAVLPEAELSDAAEPGLLRRIADGEDPEKLLRFG